MILPFNRNWLFRKGDIVSSVTDTGFTKGGSWYRNGAAEELDDTNWEEVVLPHDYVITGEFCRSSEKFDSRADIAEMDTLDSLYTSRGSLPSGVAWYRKHFTLPSEAVGKRIYLRFEGIYRDSAVYLNQYLCHKQLNGYMGFTVDVTDLVRRDGDNVLAVRTDATETEGWWYQGGGIYRSVRLILEEPVHITENGLYVRSAVNAEEKTSDLAFSLTVVNHTEKSSEQTVDFCVSELDGTTLAEVHTTVTVPPMEKGIATATLSLSDIRLWDCENPYLYLVTASLSNGSTVMTKIGFRTIVFDRDHGFFLNGVQTKLRGVCVHQGHAGIGIAEFDGIHDYKLKKLRSMGCNAYRTSHSPVSPELLDACDRLGILVMEENRLLSTGDEDRENFRRMILRDRNHPSIVLWSIGNEEPRQFSEFAAPIASTLRRMAHALDPDRPITEAMLLWSKEQKRVLENVEITAPMSKNVDVVGLNYGLVAWDKLHAEFPDKPFICTEIRSIGGTRGAVCDDRDRRHLTPFAKELLPTVESGEKAWKMTAERDYVSGMFAWTGFDYYGEPTPFNFPAVSSQFGIFDLCGFPKNGYFYYRANWRRDVSTFCLCPHWNFVPGAEKRTVYLFSDDRCDEAELFVNGVSQGKRKIEKYLHAEWKDVTFQPGEIAAIGYRNGEPVARDAVKTTGAPVALVAETEHLSGDEDGFLYAIVKLRAVDCEGQTVPTADNRVAFHPESGVIVLGSGNGDPSCLEPAVSMARPL